MQRQSAYRYKLLEYQSTAHAAFGVEVVPGNVGGEWDPLHCLQWLGSTKAFIRIPKFVVLALPDQPDRHDLQQIAQCARAQGLIGKLSLVCPSHSDLLATTVTTLRSLGIGTLLGGVGPDARFADLTSDSIDGVVLDRAFISKVPGDPHAASVLEAIVALASNLGLRTFASRCTQQAELDMAASCGVDYLTLAAEPPPAAVKYAASLRAMPSRLVSTRIE